MTSGAPSFVQQSTYQPDTIWRWMGSVAMDTNWALEPDEVERGYVLTCQSHPTSETVVLDYDA